MDERVAAVYCTEKVTVISKHFRFCKLLSGAKYVKINA